jgi:serine/threonine protein kinase
MASAVRTWAHSLKGKILGGRYSLGDVIGVGGMGAVFQGTHVKVGRQVAIKLLVPDLAEDEETGLRFHQEAQAAARIARKGVVEIFDFDDDDEYGPFLVMELLRGESLSKRIKRRNRLEPLEALSIGVQVVDALAAVHVQGIVHRDLKPANVFLAISEEGEEVVKLLDFGISRVKSQSMASGLTKPGVLLGTPRYMSPEQAWCKPDIDHRTDLYALGAILYHAISGVKPYQDLNPGRLLEAVLKRPPEALRTVCPNLSEGIYQLIELSMERDRDRRFQTAEAMRTRMIGTLEELARNRSISSGEMSEETPYSALRIADLTETVAMEPSPKQTSSNTPAPTPAAHPTPSPPVTNLGKTTVGYAQAETSRTTASGYAEVSPSQPSVDASRAERLASGNFRALQKAQNARVYESGPIALGPLSPSTNGHVAATPPMGATRVVPPGPSSPVIPDSSGPYQGATSGSFQTPSSDTFGTPREATKQRSPLKIVFIAVSILVVVSILGAGGLWGVTWLSHRNTNVAGAETERNDQGGTADSGSPQSSDSLTPNPPPVGGGAIQRWRSELQIARNERELGQLDRARERLATVVAEVEGANPQGDSQEARVGSEACLLLGDLGVRAINAGQANSGSAEYLTNLSVQHQAANQHYEHALRFGVDDMQQCTILGMARAAEWAAEASLHASQVPGLDPTEVARRQQSWRTYLEESMNAYRRAQNNPTTHPTCGPQAGEGLARVQGRLSAGS